MTKQELRDKPQCMYIYVYIYRIPCKCGREYIGEISRRLGVRINKYKYNTTRVYLIDKNLLHVFLKKDINVSETRQIFFTV
jgi:hypothetical protein